MNAMIEPYKDTRSMKIGQATVENDPACLSIYDSIDFTRDQRGLALAREFKAVIDAVIAALEVIPDLPAELAVTKPGTTKNPFA